MYQVSFPAPLWPERCRKAAADRHHDQLHGFKVVFGVGVRQPEGSSVSFVPNMRHAPWLAVSARRTRRISAAANVPGKRETASMRWRPGPRSDASTLTWFIPSMYGKSSRLSPITVCDGIGNQITERTRVQADAGKLPRRLSERLHFLNPRPSPVFYSRAPAALYCTLRTNKFRLQ